nr:DUF123 domain-containing protein [Candidatus Sigynarchaeota archaeon]
MDLLAGLVPPLARGVYVLGIANHVAQTILVGKLGNVTFFPGQYAYVGSALGGLHPRLRRHLSSNKKMHWHVDFFLQHAAVDFMCVAETRIKKECDVSQF